MKPKDSERDSERKQQETRPRASVIIPAYNMAAFLPAAVRSVLQGSMPDVEVLVFDDGSTDDTPSVMRAFTEEGRGDYDPRVRYLRQPNAGKSKAVNEGLGRARGEYLSILDADDQLPPDSLLVRLEALEKSPHRELAVGGFEVFRDNEILGQRRLSGDERRQELFQQFWRHYRTPFSLNGCLIHRSLVARVGALDTRLLRCHDIDYSMRLLREVSEVVCVEEVVYRYRKYRSQRRDRLRIRMRTAYERPMVFWKNCPPGVRLLAIMMGGVIDLGKAAYELVGNYEQ